MLMTCGVLAADAEGAWSWAQKLPSLTDSGSPMDTTSYHNMLGGCATHMCQLGYVPNPLWVTQLDNKRGFGVVAGADIKQGQFVCEYVGELITRELAQSREKVRAPPCCHQ
jgi:hypothetical protein